MYTLDVRTPKYLPDRPAKAKYKNRDVQKSRCPTKVENREAALSSNGGCMRNRESMYVRVERVDKSQVND